MRQMGALEPYPSADQISKCTMENRVRFLSGHRDSHKYAKGEAKINFVVWVWNWVFQHELVFKPVSR